MWEEIKHKAIIVYYLCAHSIFWPLVWLVGDPDSITICKAGLSIGWRNLWRRAENGAMTLEEAGVIYAAALEQGNRELAQELAAAADKLRAQHEIKG